MRGIRRAEKLEFPEVLSLSLAEKNSGGPRREGHLDAATPTTTPFDIVIPRHGCASLGTGDRAQVGVGGCARVCVCLSLRVRVRASYTHTCMRARPRTRVFCGCGLRQPGCLEPYDATIGKSDFSSSVFFFLLSFFPPSCARVHLSLSPARGEEKRESRLLRESDGALR